MGFFQQKSKPAPGGSEDSGLHRRAQQTGKRSSPRKNTVVDMIRSSRVGFFALQFRDCEARCKVLGRAWLFDESGADADRRLENPITEVWNLI